MEFCLTLPIIIFMAGLTIYMSLAMLSKQEHQRIGAERRSFSAWWPGLLSAAIVLANVSVALGDIGWADSPTFTIDTRGGSGLRIT